jgi:co-chaperonin GroES (HSP10)
MKYILTEDVDKFISPITAVIAALGNGGKKAEYETKVTVGDEIVISNIKGYWVGDLIRIDIKFRE